MNMIAIVTAALVGIGAMPAAHASSLGRPCTIGARSPMALARSPEGQGRGPGLQGPEGEAQGRCGEIYALDPNMRPRQLFLDPTSARSSSMSGAA